MFTNPNPLRRSMGQCSCCWTCFVSRLPWRCLWTCDGEMVRDPHRGCCGQFTVGKWFGTTKTRNSRLIRFSHLSHAATRSILHGHMVTWRFSPKMICTIGPLIGLQLRCSKHRSIIDQTKRHHSQWQRRAREVTIAVSNIATVFLIFQHDSIY